MITLFVALYSLLCLCTTGNTSDIKESHVKTVKLGENVTIECNVTGNKDNVFWYRQRFGEVPQFMARTYSNTLGYTFVGEFNDRRFSITLNDKRFDLNINGTKESDRGDYLCVNLDGNTPKLSGTRLQFDGEEMKPCPTPGTLNKNTHSVTHQGSNSRDGEGSSSNNHQTPTNQADDEDVLNYAAVSFAKKPSSSRTSRDTKNHQDVYAQVKIK
ncbi:uncharacterized protein LOC128514865 [Clarias gariepinus]|uniref:uncharacterized protein LOC128514865 n=1 Tax=Clarias gariepinus TaxID=13013 RepID=UPI00234DA3BB|nr:uncharacterized protein LOC128514865 [Clarias gariepinus]